MARNNGRRGTIPNSMGGLLGNMYEYSNRRRNPEDGGMHHGGMQHGGMQMHNDGLRNDVPQQMHMHDAVVMGQGQNPPAMAKRGRTPGTKVLKVIEQSTLLIKWL